MGIEELMWLLRKPLFKAVLVVIDISKFATFNAFDIGQSTVIKKVLWIATHEKLLLTDDVNIINRVFLLSLGLQPRF